MSGLPIPAGPTPDEAARAGGGLAALFARQARRYAFGDTSLRADTARELMASIAYTLDLWRRENGLPAGAPACADPDAALRQGEALAEQKLAQARTLLAAAAATAPSAVCAPYLETLRSIRDDFFRRYDPRYLAHLIPCSIDYPLCLPLPDDPPGAEYVCGYLQRIVLENRFLQRLGGAHAALMDRRVPGWRDLPVNLYGEASACAVGLALAGERAGTLSPSPETAGRVRGALRGLTLLRTHGALSAAAARVGRELSLSGPESAYLSAAADSLAPRAAAAGENSPAVFDLA